MTPLLPDDEAVALQRRNEYVEANLDLVGTIARALIRRLPPSIEYDDLVQAGSMGLLRAAELYTRAFNVPFRFYAQIRIRGEMIESVRRRRYTAETMEPLQDGHVEPPAPVSDIDDDISRRQLADRVHHALANLPEDDRAALRIYYMEQGRLAGVGAHFGVKSSRSSQILRRALDRARAECSRHGIAA